MKSKNVIISLLIASTLIACSSVNEEVSERSGIPAWTLNPTVEGGIAATDCVVFSGNLSVDRKMATANSRTTLAQQISLNIDALDKTYLNRTDVVEGSTIGNTFSSVSKQLTQQTLSGSRVIKADLVEIEDIEYFCIMTAIAPALTDALFSNIVKGSKRQLSVGDETFLRQEFKALKAEESLIEELD